MTHLSLCSGIGGIDLAAERAGFESVAVCEIDEPCRRVLKKNFPGAYQFTDIRNVTSDSLRSAGIARPTLVSAGFPCQPHSVAGKREGADDERNIWPFVVNVLRDVKPRWFLGENVRGLLSSDDGRMFGTVLGDLANLGYRVGWGCFGADEACGAPHRRDRVFIVGYLADLQSKRREGRPVSRSTGRLQGDYTDGRSAELGNPDDERREELADGITESAGHSDCGRESVANPVSGRPGGRDHGDSPRLRREVQAEGSERGMGDAESNGRKSKGSGSREDGINRAAGEDLADAGCISDERRGEFGVLPSEAGIAEGEGNQRQRGRDAARHSVFGFPPGPNELDRWRELLSVRPDLAPALTPEEEAELEIRTGTDGISGGLAGLGRRQKLKMLGNAVVPDQVQPVLDAIAEFERSAT